MSAIDSTRAKPPIEILIAEDSATQRAQLQHLLEEHGFAVVAAMNGKEALAAARRRKPALILSDITMPELDGYGLCKAVKSDDKLKDIAVILLTTLADPRDILKALDCGADNFVRKPYDEKYLLSRIDYILMSREMRKSQKMQMGLEITLDNQRHFITAERQQVLDMLIATYEQAVAINADLKTREEELTRSNQSLVAMQANLERLVEERTATLSAEIAQRARAEETIRELNADLERRVVERTQQFEEANRAKSDFLANMSHELRTPLNSIIGFSEILKDGMLGKLEPKPQRFAADIFDAGTHLLSLINDILDLSKVEAGAQELNAAAVDVRALLMASTTVVREKALTHRIRLDTELDPALGAMLADERKLKQIVYNLLSNAVKFTAVGGTVTLSARRCARAEVALDEALPGRLLALPAGEDGEFLAITVEDSGVGIAEEDLPKLFEPFSQVDSSVTRRKGGTGLGLSLVRRLTELHGGTVGVASRPGQGSRFSVWLPYRAAACAAPEDQSAPETTVLRPAPAQPVALVIEDDDRTADLIATQLRTEGFAVMRAATAEEGLVRAAKHQPQLITVDIFLPAMDGWEFMRRLKANPKLADTPVVIISLSQDMERGLAFGARRVLNKPFVHEELAAALTGLIEMRPDATPRVLVVEDNLKASELLTTILEAEGYSVLRAYDGAEAIEAARRAHPDLVILDLMLPQVSGFEVARALRETQHTADIPIVVLSAKDLNAEEHEILNGVECIIINKSSFKPNALLDEVRRALRKRSED